MHSRYLMMLVERMPRAGLGNCFPWRATLEYIFAVVGQNHITELCIMCMAVLTGIPAVNHNQICYLCLFLTCTEINHIHVLLLVGIFIIKHAMNYTEGKALCIQHHGQNSC